MKSLTIAMICFLCWGCARADLDINLATQAQLEQLRGVGPQLSGRILAARSQAPFSTWEDLRQRVTGLGPVQAAQLSREGLTVAGAAFAATDSMLIPRKRDRVTRPGTDALRPATPSAGDPG